MHKTNVFIKSLEIQTTLCVKNFIYKKTETGLINKKSHKDKSIKIVRPVLIVPGYHNKKVIIQILPTVLSHSPPAG